MPPITRNVLARVLAQQEHAYRILLRIGEAARADPTLLCADSESALLDPASCVAWLRKHAPLIPPHARVDREDEAAIAALVSAFLRTSFHIVRFEWNGRVVDAEIRRSPKHVGSQDAKRARHGGDLRAEALHRLCRDEGLRIAPALLGKLARSTTARDDLDIWCYAVGLVRRATGRSEGESEWRRWRSIPWQQRKSLNAEAVWAARGRLVERLRLEVDPTSC